MSYDCLISYASADRRWAEDLRARLKAGNFEVWYDRERLKPGFEFKWEIDAACEQARIVVPIMSPRWRESAWTRYETYRAELVVPLVYEGKWREIAPPPLRRFHYLAIDPARLEAVDWPRLYEVLRGLLASPEVERGAVLAKLAARKPQLFVGREEELNSIHERLFEGQGTSVAASRVEVVTALGGMGKTALAQEYVDRFWRCYRQIFWVNCRADLAVQFAEIASMLVPSSEPVATGREAIRRRAVQALAKLSAMEGEPRRLLVFDDAEGEPEVLEWVPKAGNCHTLITSSFTRWSAGFRNAPLFLLEGEPARRLLFRLAGRDEGTATPEEVSACDEVAKTVGGLPLALEQAGRFVHQQGAGFSFAAFLRLYRTSEISLLLPPDLEGGAYPREVFLGWRMAIERQEPGARALFRLSAFMGPAPIPVGVLIGACDELVARLRDLAGAPPNLAVPVAPPDEAQIRKWKNSLGAYSLIRVGTEDDFTIHTLLRAVEWHSVPSPQRAAWCESAMRAWARFLPRSADRFENWSRWRIGLPHVEALWKQVLQDPAVCPPPALLTELAAFLLALGRPAEAEGPARKDVELRLATVGSSDLDTLAAMETLGQILRRTGAIAEAERLLREVLRGRTACLGPEHPHTLAAMNILAGLLAEKQEQREALKLYEEALAIGERVLPPDHRDLFFNCNDLARLLERESRFADAEKLLLRAWTGLDRVLGAEHPDTLTSLQNLAGVRLSVGRFDDAERDYWRALTGLRTALGPDHPHVADCAGNLAGLLTSRNNAAVDLAQAGDLPRAEELFRHVLEQRRRLLGRRHGETLQTMRNLAGCLRRAGRDGEAELVLRRCLWISASNFRRSRSREDADHLGVALRKYWDLPASVASHRDRVEALLRKKDVLSSPAGGEPPT